MTGPTSEGVAGQARQQTGSPEVRLSGGVRLARLRVAANRSGAGDLET